MKKVEQLISFDYPFSGCLEDIMDSHKILFKEYKEMGWRNLHIEIRQEIHEEKECYMCGEVDE